MTWSHRRIGMIAALALVAGSFGVITMPNDPAKANGGGLTGPEVYAIVGALTGCGGPLGMTVVRNGVDDDTVYVACFDIDEVAYISDDSVNGSVSGSITVGSGPTGLDSSGDDTASLADDTVYVGYGTDGLGEATSIGAIPPGVTSGPSDDSITLDVYGFYAAVSRDDTVFLVFDDTFGYDTDDSLGVFNPGTSFTSGGLDSSFRIPETYGLVTFDDTLFTYGVVDFPLSLDYGVGAVNMASPSFPTLDDSLVLNENFWDPQQMVVSDDTLFVPTWDGDDSRQGLLWAIDPTDLSVDETLAIDPPPVSFAPYGLASNPQGMLIATGLSYAQIIDGRTMQNEGQFILLDTFGFSQSITRSGVAYVGSYAQDVIYRLAKLRPELNASAGAPGTEVRLTLTPTVADVTPDDSTLWGVEIGSNFVDVDDMNRSGNTFTFEVPDGCGSAPVVVSMNGQVGVELGNWTYPACPDPTPPAPIPPGAPTSVEAVAVTSPGVELPSASVSWVAPSSSGSFPITQYQVTGSPSGSCLVAAPETACEVPGLEFETEYTFTVRALSGAGWGAYSQPSNPIRPVNPEPPPVPTIIISGTRAEVRGKPGVLVTGQTTGFAEGTSLVPWLRFPGQTSYQAGSARPETNRAGAFSWQRRTGKKIYVIVRSFDESIKSNRVIIPAAGPRVGPVRQPELGMAERDLPQFALPSHIRPGLPIPVPLPMPASMLW